MKAKWKKADIYELLELFDDIIRLGGINLIHVDNLIAQNAQKLIVEHNLYSADAIHTSTAILTDSDYFTPPLTAGDGGHFEAGQGL